MEGRAGAGSLGPRLAGRLTAELVLRSPQYMNCVKEYEIDLRGNKIAAIENLGATENQFDSIDLSDNAIVRVEGFPKLPRLKTLLLNSNRITRIARHLEETIPNLSTLVLTNNRITNLSDVDPLNTLRKLQYLSLLDCPITKQPQYRLYVIHRCKHLKVLDFRKVKQKEREEAQRVFGADEAAGEAGKAKTFEPEEDLAAAEAAVKPAAEPEIRQGPTPEQQTAIKAAIANAQTLEDVQRLEAALRTGQLPSELTVGEGEQQPAEMEEG
ncbi:hypothetical protein WJX72_002612 [[Myrmecia] bisecta]|uniref:Uncharacterized protein n=1 Tax=[Myrmecia] bisecta TaxID=41462 RepID=A0AAW1R5U3_9CHLO